MDYKKLITGFEHGGSEYLFEDMPEEEDEETVGMSMPGSRDDVKISGKVDFNEAGTYTVSYDFTPEDGVTASTKLAVVVG